jgi:hypothetical protein
MNQPSASPRASTKWWALGCVALAASLGLAASAQAAGFGDMLGALAGRSAGGYSEPGALDDAVARLARQLNKTTPKEITNDVRLDSVSSRKSELTYHYTFLSRSAAEVPSDVFNTRLAPTVKHRLCQDEQSLRLLKSGARIGYQYRGRDGNEIGKLSFAQRDCNEAG